MSDPHTEAAADLSEATVVLKKILQAHNLPCPESNGWLVPNGQFPVVGARWMPSESGKTGMLSVRVYFENQTEILENFAGLGEGEKGLANGFENFMRNSLHVMLAALWDTPNAEQVTEASWTIGGKPYTAYIGGIGMRAFNGAQHSVPEGFLEKLQAAIEKEKFTNDYHWVRVFFASAGDDRTYEALLDNRPWPVGEVCLRGLPWEASEDYYSARLFMIFKAQ